MTRTIFGLGLTDAHLRAIMEHGERMYPSEACGLLLGPAADTGPLRVEPLANVQDRYHQRDPSRFPRTSRDAFRVDELERLRLLERADRERQVERALYHSHCDVGAYFSPEDRAMAVVDGVELMPGVVHLVASIVAGRGCALAAFRYDRDARRFVEHRVPLAPPTPWPDVASRAMTGRAEARLAPPVGGRLLVLQADADEEAGLRACAKAAVELAPVDVLELRRLALGLWSPALGFADGDPCAPCAVTPRPPASAGQIVELREGGVAVGALRLAPGARLVGDVVAYGAALARSDVDAAEVRAELVRRAPRRVVATVGVGGALALTADGTRVAVAEVAGSPHLGAQAIMAQNLGASILVGAPRPLPPGVTLAVEPPPRL